MGTSYLLYIDEYFSISVDRNRVLDGMIEDLPLLAPEDRMAVVAFDGRELEMLSTWSQSVDRLQRVLRDAKNRRTFGLQRLAERRQWELTSESLESLVLFGAEDGEVGPVPTFQRELTIEERAYVQRLSAQINRSVAATNGWRGTPNTVVNSSP